jgi:hypothetical protein
MSNGTEAVCADCGKQTLILLDFGEFAGVRPCKVRDDDNTLRDSLEPFFKHERSVCYPCYCHAAQKDIAAAKRGVAA